MEPKVRLKILTVCAGGTVRSVAMALKLKRRGHDAVALAGKFNSPELFEMLSKWADRILLMHAGLEKKIPKEYHTKMVLHDLGDDVWTSPQIPHLYNLCTDIANKERL